MNGLSQEQLDAIKARRESATADDIDALLSEIERCKREWRFWSAFWKDAAVRNELMWREAETLRQTELQALKEAHR